ncbi:MAG TPA: beta-L-arabinofuranosidase domain-containing protein, partial [Longimicrobiales bacterium]
GYFIDAGIAHHRATKGADRRLYDAARKLADCWDAHIGPAPKQEWYDGHQAMEMALIRLGRYVDQTEGPGKGERYFRLAKFLLDCRGRGDRGEGAEHGPQSAGYEYDQSHAPVVQQYEAVGHAVRAAYLYSAMADVAMQTRDPDYTSAVRSLFTNIADRKYYVTGGIGSGETSEGFGPEFSLPNDGYCESCSSCAEIFFQARMNRLYKDTRAADLLEDALYNALLGSLDLQARHYYYDNPPDANVARYSWHVCPCCVGNIPRTLLSLPSWTYLRGRDGLYVNLFMGGTVTVDDVAGTAVTLAQETGYPWNGRVRIRLTPERPREFALHVRVPDRAPSPLYKATPAAAGDVAIRVNGHVVRARVERGYAVVRRRWRAGDTVDLGLPMTVQRLHPDPRMKALAGRVALKYGPLLYNIESVDQDIGQALERGARLTTEWRGDLLGGVTVIKGRFASGEPLLAIPNFARYNRGAAPTEYPLEPEKPADGSQPRPFPPTSLVWIREA